MNHHHNQRIAYYNGCFVPERATVIELAEKLDIPMAERGLDLYDAYTADEVFITSTSLCVCPVSSVNGAKIAGGKVPGPVTQRILDAYSELVDCDIVGQHLSRLDEGIRR